MGDVAVAELLIRTVVALAIVLSIVAVAYGVMRRRATGRTGGLRSGRSGLARRGVAPAIEVVARVGLTRDAALMAVRFGDRVMLVSVGEQTPASVLAEMSTTDWEELHTVREPLEPDGAPSIISRTNERPSFFEALREATTRHG